MLPLSVNHETVSEYDAAHADTSNEEEAPKPAPVMQTASEPRIASAIPVVHPNPFAQYAFQPPAWRSATEKPFVRRFDILCPSPDIQPVAKAGSAPSTPSPSPSKRGKLATVRGPRMGDEAGDGDGEDGAQGSPSGAKRVKIYHNLRGLSDQLAAGLDVVFCGINPGEQSAQIGHHYANPTNHFWACLHQSGLTSRMLNPREDYKITGEFAIGLTNLVARPTVEQIELSRKEQVDGVPALLDKVCAYQPRLVCFVGLSIAEIVRAALAVEDKKKGKGKLKEKADVGLQTYKVVHAGKYARETLFYTVSSTSGRVVKYQKTDKIQQFKDLRELVREVKNGGFNSSGLAVVRNPSAISDPLDPLPETRNG